MKRRLVALACSVLVAPFAAVPAAEDGAPMTNSFYAMDTAFQRPGLNAAQQLDVVKDLGFAGIACHLSAIFLSSDWLCQSAVRMKAVAPKSWFPLRLALTLIAGLQAAPPLSSAQTPLTVRVDSAGGAPRWVVNVEPKRARVFWGAPGPSQIAVSTMPQSVTFDFVALGSASNATMHFGFSQVAGEVYLDHVNTIEDTNRELVRNLAQEACRNFGTWWMDLGASGWFNDRRMWVEMARMNALDQAFLTQPAPFQPEVAAVLDERGICCLAADGSRVTGPGIYEARAALGRLGAPYGQYLSDDVLNGRVWAKLFVFLNAWSLSPEQRAKPAHATLGRACLWCYAPGYFDGGRARGRPNRSP